MGWSWRKAPGAMLAAALATALGGAAGAQECSSPRAKVVGGDPAYLKDWPGYAALRFDDRYVCGGAVIDREWVLTAAHCFDGGRLEKLNSGAMTLTAAIGAENIKDVKPEQLYPAASWTVHPSYEKAIPQGDDIALIKLAKPYEGEAMRISLSPDSDPQLGAILRVAGFGTTYYGQQLQPVEEQATAETRFAGSDQFQEATLDFVPPPPCRDANSFKDNFGAPIPVLIGDGQLCAAPPEALGKLHGSCQGDSGGPLVGYKDGCPVQVGVVSWAYECGRAEYPGVFTRVSHYRDWILRTIGRTPQTLSELDPTDRLSDQAVIEARRQLEELLGAARKNLGLAVLTASGAAARRFPVGQEVKFEVESKVDGQLYIIDINAKGVATLIFPNAYVLNARATEVKAGQKVVIPNGPQYAGLQSFAASPPTGKSLMIAVVAPKGLTFEGEAAKSFSGTKGFDPVPAPAPALQSLIGQVDAAMAAGGEPEKWGLHFFEYEITD